MNVITKRGPLENLQILIILNALCILLAVPRYMPIVYEYITGIGIFFLTLYTTYILFRMGIIWIALFLLVMLVYYNPIFTAAISYDYPSSVPVFISLFLFTVALLWGHIVNIHLK